MGVKGEKQAVVGLVFTRNFNLGGPLARIMHDQGTICSDCKSGGFVNTDEFWILDFRFWIGYAWQIQNPKSKIQNGSAGSESYA